MKFLLLFIMIFLHIVDDYRLQGILASLKQKSWWEENAPDEMYKHDYIMALFMHSFSWAFMIMIVPSIYLLTHLDNMSKSVTLISIFLITNLLIHMHVDDLKANRKRINLIGDQLFHLWQIIATWAFLIWIN